MKSLMIALALFTLVKGPEYYQNYIDIKHKKVKSAIETYYGTDPLVKLGIKFPDVVRAQIALETCWLTSDIYKDNGNMFGMKASSRNWDCGNQHGHANYNCTDSKIPAQIRSLCDYRDWQAMRFEQASNKGIKIPKTNKEYIYFLQHLPGGGAYAEDPAYPNKLRYIMSL